MRKEMEKRKNSPRRNYKLNSIQSDLRWIKHQLERLERKIEDIDD